jgi:hypothetical protein
VLKAAALSEAHPDYVRLRDLRRLTIEVHLRDPLFSAVTGPLEKADAAGSASDRVANLADAARALTTITLDPAILAPAVDPIRVTEGTEALWAAVYDRAISPDARRAQGAAEVAWRAVDGGRQCREALATPRSEATGRSAGNGPAHIRWGAPEHWVAAALVLKVLDGAPPAAAASAKCGRSGPAPSKAHQAALLTAAGTTLQRAGWRWQCAMVDRAAWEALGRRQPPGDLLQLTVHAAALRFSHGDITAAEAAMPARVRGRIVTPRPTGPAAPGIGDLTSRVYPALARALNDPGGQVDSLRLLWLEMLGAAATRPVYPCGWLLAGTLVQFLSASGEKAAAEAAARMTLWLMPEPADPSEEQLRTRLTDISGWPADRPGNADPLEVLLDDVVRIARAVPEPPDEAASTALRGLVELARAVHPGLRWPRHGPPHHPLGGPAE